MQMVWFLLLLNTGPWMPVPLPYPSEQACLHAARTTIVQLPPWDQKIRGDKQPYPISEGVRFACLPVPKTTSSE